MLSKPLVLALLAACGVHPTFASADEQPVAPPDTGDDVQEDQHFCCKSVDVKTWTGKDCSTLSKDNIDFCAEVLYCPGKWAKHDGVVTCE